MSVGSYPATLPAAIAISLPSDVVIVTLPATLLAIAEVLLKPVALLILETISSTLTALTFAPVNVTGIFAAPFMLKFNETLPACVLKLIPSERADELATESVASPLCLFNVKVASSPPSAHKSPTFGEVYVLAYTTFEFSSATMLSTEKDAVVVEYSFTTIFDPLLGVVSWI